MRVLHIITGLRNAGAEAALYRLVSRDSNSSTHEVVSMIGEGYYGERLNRVGVRVHALEMPRRRLTLAGLAKLYRIVRSFDPDIVQTWMHHANVIGGIVSRLAGNRAVVWGVHSSNVDPTRTSGTALRVARAGAWLSGFVPKKVVCCSEGAEHSLLQMGYRASSTCVVHNGVDVEEFKPDAQARRVVRDEWSATEDEILIGMVARWHPLKDHSNLFAAMEYVKTRTRARWRVVLVGPDMVEVNDEAVALLNKHGVRDRVLFAGSREDVPAVMNALDLHVLSSSAEAFGNVTVEAMSCEVPAVVTSVGAGDKIVGETGWIVEPSDPAALGNAILKAIDAMAVSDNWLKRKAACRERVIEHFSIERMIDAYHGVWETALASSR